MELSQRQRLEKYIDAAIDDINRLSDDEILSKAAEDFDDAEAAIADIREKINEAIITYMPAENIKEC